MGRSRMLALALLVAATAGCDDADGGGADDATPPTDQGPMPADADDAAPPSDAAPLPDGQVADLGPPAPDMDPPAPDMDPPVPDMGAEPADCVRPPVVAGPIERTLFVDPAGDDDAGDGSRARPFGTLGHAVDRATPGTAVRLLPGSYPGGTFLVDVRGEPGAPIVVGGEPDGPRPVIDAAGDNEGLHLVRPRWVVLEHLEVRGARDNGINVDDGGDYADPEAARHITMRGLVVEDIGPTGNRDCLKLSGLDDFEVRDSVFRRCGDGGSGVDMVGCHDGFIAGNTFTELGSSGVQAKGGTARVRVANNRFTGAGARPVNMGGSTGFEFFRPPLDPDGPNAEARHIEVVSNLVVGGQTASAFVGCIECVFAHNTVIDPDNWLLRVLQETTSRDGFAFEAVRDGWVTGNIFVFTRGQVRTAVNVGPNTEVESFRFTHNLFFAEDAPENSDPQTPGEQVGAIVGASPALDDDRRPTPGSPALGAGDPAAQDLLEATLDGRCYDTPPTLGALEAFDGME